MQQRCSLIEINNQYITAEIGRGWELGPVGLMKEPGSDRLSILIPKEVLEKSFYTPAWFKQAVMADSRIPVCIKMSIDADRGPYDLGEVEFDESVMAWYRESVYKWNYIEFIFELVVKGKELEIFNGVSANTERTGNTKPLFWASVLKGNIH